MNIVVVTDTLNLGNGGVGTCVNDLCLAFRKLNNRVLLVGVVDYQFQDDDMVRKLLSEGIEIYNIGATSRKDALVRFPVHVCKLSNKLKEWTCGEPTICNIHLKMGVLYGSVASAKHSNILCVETYHNTYHHYHIQCWTLSPIIKKYITVSRTAKQEMQLRFKIQADRIVAIPNGVDRSVIRNSVEGEQNKYEHHSILTLLSVGRLSPEKNFLTSIEAFKTVDGVNYRYIVIGDGPEMTQAKEKITDNILLLGQQSRDEVLKYLAKADIIVMPSLWEGRSIFMLEAAAFDIPFILSDVPGLREPFGESELGADEDYRRTKFGYLVRTMDAEAYRKALIDFAEHPDIRLGMREEVRKMSVENDMSNVVQAYMNVFGEVLKRGR